MGKNKKKSIEPAKNAQELMIEANNSVATDNQNINPNHNVKKVSLGPNTKR